MSIENYLSEGNKAEAISMALEIIDVELYGQMLILGLNPDTFQIDQEITIDYFSPIPDNCPKSQWLAYHAIPQLISRRIALVAKLGEINNA